MLSTSFLWAQEPKKFYVSKVGKGICKRACTIRQFKWGIVFAKHKEPRKNYTRILGEEK